MPGGTALSRPMASARPGPAPAIRIGRRRRDGVVSGGALTRPGRAVIRSAAPRFRIKSGPGSGLSGRRPATPRFRPRPLASTGPLPGRRPRFGYRKWRILAFLTRRRGGRRQVWRINSRWTGGEQ
jgi:hypothetical protein